MNVKVHYCEKPFGSVTPESSKSISNRVLLIDALSGFACKLKNLSGGEDTRIMQRLLEEYKNAQGSVKLNAGMAGTVMRFMTTFCAMGDKEVLLTGSERMLQRPIKELVTSLNTIGASVTYAEKEGFAPLLIKPSNIKGGKLSINATVSSQFISSLMLCAPYFEDGLHLELEGIPVSLSYILLTQQMMEYFGVKVKVNTNAIHIEKQTYRPDSFTVEGDWSSASYFYALAALSSSCEIELKNMNPHSLQGDKAIADMAALFGVESILVNDGLVIRKKHVEIPVSIKADFVMCPDIAQTMAAMCAGNKIKEAAFEGLSTLAGKETDRIRALEEELKAFGVLFYGVKNDRFKFDAAGFTGSKNMVRTWKDHRMAMSFAPLAQKTGTLTIEDALVVQKSYPDFWKHLNSLGCLVENTDI